MEKTVQFPKLGLEFTFPNGFDIGPLHVAFYGIIIATGLILALIYAFRVFRKVGVDPDKAIDCILGGILGGIVGARIYFVAFSWDHYGFDFSSWGAFWDSFFDLFKIWEGGLAIYGGLIGALLVGIWIARRRKVCVPALLDVVGVGFLLGQGIGRWGNFFNVEAFGSNTTLPWGMTGPDVVRYLTNKQEELAALGITVDPNVPVHPCFLYESLWCLAGFVILALYLKHRKFDGEVFLMYLGFYGAERMIVEGLRTDSLMIGRLRISQLLAALLLLVSVATILVIRRRIKRSDGKAYPLFVLSESGQRIAAGKSADVSETAPSKNEAGTEARKADPADTEDFGGQEENTAGEGEEVVTAGKETVSKEKDREDKENERTNH